MSDSNKKPTIGFIGAGQMATALARGFLAAKSVEADSLVAFDVIPAATEKFSKTTGARTVTSIRDVAEASDVFFLAVKPQQMSQVLSELRDVVTEKHLIVSIAAGVSLKTMTTHLGSKPRLIRVMPNTPSLVGSGASAYSRGSNATDDDTALIQGLLATVGTASEVPEKLMDAVTGLSGSGPAYVYQIIEALSDGGVRMGLPRDAATKLAAQTVLGAAQMVLSTGQHPGQLKDAVTSPGGTTIAGIHALEKGGLRASLMNAVEAATLRARELDAG